MDVVQTFQFLSTHVFTCTHTQVHSFSIIWYGMHKTLLILKKILLPHILLEEKLAHVHDNKMIKLYNICAHSRLMQNLGWSIKHLYPQKLSSLNYL